MGKDRFGDLQAELLRLDTRFLDQGKDLLLKTILGQLDGGDVDGNAKTSIAQLRQAAEKAQGLAGDDLA